MKVLAAAMAVLLLVGICSLAEADPGDSSIGTPFQPQDIIPTSCCFNYLSRPVPRRLIASAHRTSNACPQPAVIVVTRNGKMLCADPETRWVQRYLKDLEILES
ncbi:C-C motif chemokine 3-like [Neopelma chrysocephalum]|uniref:C-C motif chemokine 3-like n=1 Tax=Neopelma chrysocephalum TaxID=114329 RepID=UPI000FCD13C3|nr:C-C motif chemokine 3-like [Neopelma chrysocephalum]